jgi:hypothetical protein
MADDMTATPPDAAETFLQEWHKTTTSEVHVFQEEAGPYKKIKLHDFKFLGKNFQPQSYVGTKNGARVAGTEHTGAGVCAEFRDVLFNAQRLIFRSYAAQVRSKGEEPSESGFTQWCNIGIVSGWQFRSRQHSKGAAIDLDPKTNPYVPTGKVSESDVDNGAKLGGEVHSALDSKTLGLLRKACLETYVRAFKLVYGTNMPNDAMGHGTAQDTALAYDEMVKVHYAVVVYSQLAYLMTKDNRLTSSFGFARSFGPESDPSSFQASLKTFRPLVKGTLGTDLQQQFNTIRDDYEKLRLGMVYGKLKTATPGHMNSGVIWEQATRDPCWGFLTIRKEIAVGLRAAGCRWGAMDFGAAQNGDMMHFDKKWSIDQIAHNDDPNSDGLLYAQK